MLEMPQNPGHSILISFLLTIVRMDLGRVLFSQKLFREPDSISCALGSWVLSWFL